MRALLLATTLITSAQALELRDYSPYNYEVLFTNPICESYEYERPVYNIRGERLKGKPSGVYCKKSDAQATVSNESSPEYRLVEWINDPKTKEVFFSYLSFSNERVAKAICDNVYERNLKVEFIVDKKTTPEKLKLTFDCDINPEFKKPNIPKVNFRGHTQGIGYAHNKYFIVNPNSSDEVKVAFSSGNLSSGTSLHHENWHFITTNARSHFFQMHLCMKDGTLHHDQSKAEYVEFIKNCKSEIKTVEEEDIKVLLIPGDGEKAMNLISEAASEASSISLAAHRFSNKDLISILSSELKNDKKVRLIVDDDMHWIAKDKNFRGLNRKNEFFKVMSLVKEGMKVKYMQTNHAHRLLHHNKFLIFEGGAEEAVFAGAGNLTGAAFSTNFENFYFIKNSDVVEAFKEQYKKMYDQMATSFYEMPKFNALP